MADAGVRVWETRTLADCWSELAESPASFLVVELGGNVAGLLGRMARQPREFPAARLAVVADRSLAGYEWLMREAGRSISCVRPGRSARWPDWPAAIWPKCRRRRRA